MTIRSVLSQKMNRLASLVSQRTQEEAFYSSKTRLVKGVVRNRSGKVVQKSRLSIEECDELLSQGYDFSSMTLTDEDLHKVCVEMLMRFVMPTIKDEYAEDNEAVMESVKDLATIIQSKYCHSAYHSFAHAMDVTQLMYYFVTTYFLQKLTPQEPFFLFFVCLCHDLGHPGCNIDFLHENGMLKQFETLEHYHIHETENLILKHSLFNLYMKQEYQAELLNLSRNLINATNLVQHRSVIQSVRKNFFAPGSLQLDQLMLLIDVCDLANIVRPFEHAKLASVGVVVEINAANDIRNGRGSGSKAKDLEHLKRKLMFKQKKHLDKMLSEDKISNQVADNSLSFIQSNVKPMAILLSKLDKDAAEEYLNKLDVNVNQWMSYNL